MKPHRNGNQKREQKRIEESNKREKEHLPRREVHMMRISATPVETGGIAPWSTPPLPKGKWQGGWETFHSKWRKRYKLLVSLNGGKPPPEVLILEDYQQCMEAARLHNGTQEKENIWEKGNQHCWYGRNEWDSRNASENYVNRQPWKKWNMREAWEERGQWKMQRSDELRCSACSDAGLDPYHDFHVCETWKRSQVYYRSFPRGVSGGEIPGNRSQVYYRNVPRGVLGGETPGTNL